MNTVEASQLLQELMRPGAYRDPVGTVECFETHISYVFLAGDFAYKIKKTIRNSFLDYSDLELREQLCRKEVELNRRFAPQIYLGTVPITLRDGKLTVDGDGEPVEFAVKMRRFPDGSLISHRFHSIGMPREDVSQLATCLATFHAQADRVDLASDFGKPQLIWKFAEANFTCLEQLMPESPLVELKQWTNDAFTKLRDEFERRRSDGYVRACHGDLHLENVVDWNGEIIPFDGIEFNEELRWIDVLSDAAFLFMDFTARGRPDLAYRFLNDYLESTGDYDQLHVFRWYAVYRALVRAMVAAIRQSQSGISEHDAETARIDCRHHISLAEQLTKPSAPPRLLITHGLSGSGKSFGTESSLETYGALRLRSDVERCRMFEATETASLDINFRYSPSAIAEVYERLEWLAGNILSDGYSVIVDATFLRHADRCRFHQLARRHHAAFNILCFEADESVLRERITRRFADGDDPSEADLTVLKKQIAAKEPLTMAESGLAIDGGIALAKIR